MWFSTIPQILLSIDHFYPYRVLQMLIDHNTIIFSFQALSSSLIFIFCLFPLNSQSPAIFLFHRADESEIRLAEAT